LSPRISLSSSKPTASVIQSLRDGTQSYWSLYWLNTGYDGSIISLFMGSLVLVWCSRRGPFGVLLPRPVFLARVISETSGSSIVGHFSGPAPDPFCLMGLGFASLFLFATEGFSAALWGFVLCVLVSWWLASRSLASDQAIVEERLSSLINDANA